MKLVALGLGYGLIFFDMEAKIIQICLIVMYEYICVVGKTLGRAGEVFYL
jgi:hypothetical protein